MKRACLVTPAAETDLVSIGTYIAEDDLAAAARQVAKLTSRSLLLAKFPGMGRPDPARPGRRTFVSKPYLIVYRETESGIEILRYLHTRRDRYRV